MDNQLTFLFMFVFGSLKNTSENDNRINRGYYIIGGHYLMNNHLGINQIFYAPFLDTVIYGFNFALFIYGIHMHQNTENL